MSDASKLIDNQIAQLTGWQQKTFSEVRRMILEADPEITEELKWKGAPVWDHAGNVCLAKAFKEKIKVTFPAGAKLPDPDHVFNAELEGNAWRAIDLYEGDKLNEKAFKTLVKAGVEYNLGKGKKAAGKRKK